MKKINKITNIALIFTLIGVFLCANLAYPLPCPKEILRLQSGQGTATYPRINIIEFLVSLAEDLEMRPDLLIRGLSKTLGQNKDKLNKETLSLISTLAKDLKEAGVSSENIGGILDVVIRQTNITKTVKRLQESISNLRNTKDKRELLTQTTTLHKFIRSILKTESKEEIGEGISGVFNGNAFVVDEIDGYYILLTNSHVIKNNNAPFVELKTFKNQPIGTASVVVRHNADEPDKGEDIAILVIKKEREKLSPINTTYEFKDGDIAVNVSALNKKVSSGQILPIENMVLLLGAYGKDGDSGSPYMVKRGEKYYAFAVNARSGPSGISFIPEIIEDMVRAIDNEASKFRKISEKSLEIEVARKFLQKVRIGIISDKQPAPSHLDGIQEVQKLIKTIDQIDDFKAIKENIEKLANLTTKSPQYTKTIVDGLKDFRHKRWFVEALAKKDPQKPKFDITITPDNLCPIKEIAEILKKQGRKGQLKVEASEYKEDKIKISLLIQPENKIVASIELTISNGLEVSKTNPNLPRFIKDALWNERSAYFERFLGGETERIYYNLNWTANIGYFWLDDSLRGQGIGEAWYENYLEPYFVKQGFQSVSLCGTCRESPKVDKFWEKRGFSHDFTLNQLYYDADKTMDLFSVKNLKRQNNPTSNLSQKVTSFNRPTGL